VCAHVTCDVFPWEPLCVFGTAASAVHKDVKYRRPLNAAGQRTGPVSMTTLTHSSSEFNMNIK